MNPLTQNKEAQTKQNGQATDQAPEADSSEKYTVQKGDNFAQICFNELGRKDYLAVARELGIKNPSRIQAGQEIDFGKLQKAPRTTELDNNKIANTALRLWSSDDAGAGNCAQGVRNVMEACGVQGYRRQPSAYLVMDVLERLIAKADSNWCRVKIDSPEQAPNGAILCFDRNPPGKRSGNGGSAHGHIEIVVHTDKETLYVSDKARTNYGGTVKNNWDGYAYVYKGK